MLLLPSLVSWSLSIATMSKSSSLPNIPAIHFPLPPPSPRHPPHRQPCHCPVLPITCQTPVNVWLAVTSASIPLSERVAKRHKPPNIPLSSGDCATWLSHGPVGLLFDKNSHVPQSSTWLHWYLDPILAMDWINSYLCRQFVWEAGQVVCLVIKKGVPR
jgi:hypothetical protein